MLGSHFAGAFRHASPRTECPKKTHLSWPKFNRLSNFRPRPATKKEETRPESYIHSLELMTWRTLCLVFGTWPSKGPMPSASHVIEVFSSLRKEVMDGYSIHFQKWVLVVDYRFNPRHSMGLPYMLTLGWCQGVQCT